MELGDFDAWYANCEFVLERYDGKDWVMEPQVYPNLMSAHNAHRYKLKTEPYTHCRIRQVK